MVESIIKANDQVELAQISYKVLKNFGMGQSFVSKHVRLMERVGLVEMRGDLVVNCMEESK